MSIDKKEPLFKNPIESNDGLSIDDLNKYLPAINKIEDLSMTANQMRDGLFLGLAANGIKKIPDDSIDLIITEPPESPLGDTNESRTLITNQKYLGIPLFYAEKPMDRRIPGSGVSIPKKGGFFSQKT